MENYSSGNEKPAVSSFYQTDEAEVLSVDSFAETLSEPAVSDDTVSSSAAEIPVRTSGFEGVDPRVIAAFMQCRPGDKLKVRSRKYYLALKDNDMGVEIVHKPKMGHHSMIAWG